MHKKLAVKNSWGSPVESYTVLMCSHSSVQGMGAMWSWEVRHSLGSGTMACGLQPPLCCWHSPAISHHTHWCAWWVSLQPLSAGQIMSSKLSISSQSLPWLPQSHTHIPGLPGCPSCTDRASNTHPEVLPLAGTTCVTCALDQQDTPA